jgi:hypothetical protein
MKAFSKWTSVVAMAVGVTVLAMTPVAAQQQGRNRQGNRNYDPETVITVQATVQEVVTETNRRGGSGVHLVLQTEAEPTVVHVAPATFLSTSGWEFAAGDAVTVVGSKTVVNGEPALIAREISRGEASLELRSEAGVPAWRGQGRRGQGRGGSGNTVGRQHRGGGANCPGCPRGGGGPRGQGRIG